MSRSHTGSSISSTASPIVRVVPTALGRLRDAVGGRPPLGVLEPVDYAAGHALFESRSDQRANLTSWLVEHVTSRAGRATRVLSIGCGDGSVDVAIAAALTDGGRRVEYVGVEPHAPSARAFLSRLADVAGVTASVLTEPFERSSPDGLFDVVVAVHSLYYVTDLAATLRTAHALLAPGGELIVLHAPLEPLNVLVRLLSPGLRQAFGDELETQLSTLGRGAPQIVRLDNRLDLTTVSDVETDRQLIAFTVQAQLPSSLLPDVLAALAERARPEPGLVLDHPVDVYVVTASS